MHPLLSCLGLAVAYVAPFYLRPKRSRNVRETVVFRMTCTCVTSSVAWVPLWLELAKSVSHSEPALPPTGPVHAICSGLGNRHAGAAGHVWGALQGSGCGS